MIHQCENRSIKQKLRLQVPAPLSSSTSPALASNCRCLLNRQLPKTFTHSLFVNIPNASQKIHFGSEARRRCGQQRSSGCDDRRAAASAAGAVEPLVQGSIPSRNRLKSLIASDSPRTHPPSPPTSTGTQVRACRSSAGSAIFRLFIIIIVGVNSGAQRTTCVTGQARRSQCQGTATSC